MGTYRRVEEQDIDAVQFVDVYNPPRGVRGIRHNQGTTFVITLKSGDRAEVVPGDWIVAYSADDTEHYYPIKNHVFERTYKVVV